MIQSRLYELAEKVTSFLVLNFLWLITCLPILTIFPATSAVMGVVRSWQQTDDFEIFPLYFRQLREHFRVSFILGAIAGIAGVILFVNFFAIGTMPDAMRWFFTIMNAFLSLIYLAVLIFLSPVRAHFRLGTVDTLKVAFVLSHQRFGITALCVLLLLSTAAIVWIIPITMFVAAGPTAYVIYALCSRTFPEGEPKLTIAHDETETGERA